MTTIANLLSPAIMHSLGWTLVHFLWQGTALAALAAASMALSRRASARYVIGVSALVLMLAAPAATFFLLAQPGSIAAQNPSPHIADVHTSRTVPVTPAAKSASSTSSQDALPWLVEAWLIGVAFFSLRTVGGFLLLERQQRKQSIAVTGRLLEICVALQHRLGVSRVIRFCECTWLQAPAVIGWFRPVVLLPITALTGLTEDQLQSVIAHELAHIKRLDAFVNIFQVCVESLLFYHPAVWWLNHRIRAEREHCCDDMAVSLCGNPVEYARALTLMEEWRSAPSLVMAANRGPLSERIVRLLGLKSGRNTTSRAGLTGSVFCLVAALVAGNALLGMAYPKPTAYAGATSIRHISLTATAPAQAAAATPSARPIPASTPQSAMLPAVAALAQPVPAPQTATPSAVPPPATISLRVEQMAVAVLAEVRAAVQVVSKPSPAQAPQPAAKPAAAQSYVEAMKSAGLANLSADDLIALKIQDVTPEYIREMHELGIHPDAEGFIAMRVQGVTPEYIRELRSLGFTPDEDQIIALKVQDVNADYVRGLKEVGIKADGDQIIGLKVQGVTPDYVRDLRAAGLTVDSNDVVALKSQDVTPAYVHGLQELGLKPSTQDVIGMRVQGVTPDYIREIRSLGLKPSAEEIIGMQVQGVTPEYIKALQSAGFKPSVNEVISAKVQDITPEFIELARKHGFQNLTINKLIQLKNVGVLDSKGDI